VPRNVNGVDLGMKSHRIHLPQGRLNFSQKKLPVLYSVSKSKSVPNGSVD